MSIEIVESKVTRRYKSGYEIREEVWKLQGDDASHTPIRSAYTHDGDYIGDTKTAYYLCNKLGIKPEKADPRHCVCSIGFSEKDQKWYGWSHRAIYGFTIGSTCTKDDVHYMPSDPEEIIAELKNFYSKDYIKNAKYKVVDNKVILSGEQAMCEYEEAPDGQLLVKNSTVWEPFVREIPVGKGEWIAETLEDAKQMAMDFAEGVS